MSTNPESDRQENAEIITLFRIESEYCSSFGAPERAPLDSLDNGMRFTPTRRLTTISTTARLEYTFHMSASQLVRSIFSQSERHLVSTVRGQRSMFSVHSPLEITKEILVRVSADKIACRS